jgi:hypothetical protein
MQAVVTLSWVLYIFQNVAFCCWKKAAEAALEKPEIHNYPFSKV